MGCQSEVYIGDNLTFSITCHDPDTGVLTDADSAPAYRVYEDETATPILTGNMAKLDDANTTGFYTEQIACTAGNGFEDRKSYTIYIEATVDSDTGGICYGFRAIDGVKLADQALTASKIGAGALVEGKFGAAFLTASKIDAGAFIASKFGTDFLTAAKLAASAAEKIADAMLDEPLADHDTEDSLGNVINDLTEESGGTYRFTEAALSQAPTEAEAGAGSETFTYTLTSTVDSAPIANASIWATTTNHPKENIVASGTTNNYGVVIFYLDPGTYYIWREKSGWNFTNPDTETVA